MRYLALCCDYDGTLAEDGRVSPTTKAALKRLRASGRKLLLVTGRILEELKTVCDCLELFDRVVAENGASLYNPETGEERLLAQRPSELFIQTLRDRGVQPLSVGRVIIAAWRPHETILLNAIRDLGLELQVIFNKDAVMVLPSGVNKASGLTVALQEINLSPRNIVGVGDAENDHAFLGFCEIGVAVDNALPLLKSSADFVTRNARGAGVVEVIDELLQDDLCARGSGLARHRVVLGLDESGKEILVQAQVFNGLLAGDSSVENRTVAAGLLTRLIAEGYNFCVIDTEGIYAEVAGALNVGTARLAPTLAETRQLLNTYAINLVVNLASVGPSDRRNFLVGLLGQIQDVRARTGRPHWLVIATTEDLLPAAVDESSSGLSFGSEGIVRIIAYPQLIARAALGTVTSVLALGKDPQKTLVELSKVAGIAIPQQAPIDIQKGEALYWSIAPAQAPRKIALPVGRAQEQPGTQQQ